MSDGAAVTPMPYSHDNKRGRGGRLFQENINDVVETILGLGSAALRVVGESSRCPTKIQGLIDPPTGTVVMVVKE